MYHAFPREVAGKDVIVVGATHNDQSHQELMDLIAGARFWNAETVSVVIPYLVPARKPPNLLILHNKLIHT
jgi:ribose-phosphate pyrophosphokinase